MDTIRDELWALRQSKSSPKARELIEMIALFEAGWSTPRIVAPLDRLPQTVRDALRAYLVRGITALRRFRNGPAFDLERRARDDDAPLDLLVEARAWTSRQLGEALADVEITLGPRRVRRHLRRLGSRYHRTASTLKLKQDLEKAASVVGSRSIPIAVNLKTANYPFSMLALILSTKLESVFKDFSTVSRSPYNPI